MIFSFFSAYGFSETETTEDLFQFRSGFFKPSETNLSAPREILTRTFPFTFLQHFSILDVLKNTIGFDISKTGILCGSVTGGISNLSAQYKRYNAKGVQKISPLTVPQTIHNSGSSVLAIEHKLKGISSGYNCMETSGLEALCDGLSLIKAQEFDNIFIGTGEELCLKQTDLQLVGGVILLSNKKLGKDFIGFDMECVLNRGKPWLTAKNNLTDLLDEYFGSVEKRSENPSIKENWVYFNFQDTQKIDISSYPVEWVVYSQFYPFLSLAPFLGISLAMQYYTEFKLLTISSEGHAIVISFKKVVH